MNIRDAIKKMKRPAFEDKPHVPVIDATKLKAVLDDAYNNKQQHITIKVGGIPVDLLKYTLNRMGHSCSQDKDGNIVVDVF